MPTKKKISLKIDDVPVEVDAGTTIMEAAEQLGIRIPRLCYHPDLSLAGSCRVCVVDVKGMGFYMAACSSQVWEGMEVQTNSPEIRKARRDIVELLVDNHNMDCQICERDGHCELQNLAYAMGVRARHFAGRRKRFPLELSSHSVVRDSEKCVLCGRCVRVCAEIQGVYNLSQHGRGFETVVTPAHGANMDDSVCIQCGQCINVCPTAAFLEKRGAGPVWAAIADPEMHVVVQTAPSIRAAIGEGFGLPPGTPATGQMITALRRLGFDRVFDTDFGADLTIIEEAHELLTRLKEGPLPMITSCSPGWISFMEKFYPELIPHASTCRSPMSMLSVLTVIRPFLWNIHPTLPASDSPEDVKDARRWDGFQNRWFLDAVFKGAYPEDMLAEYERFNFAESVEDGDLAVISSPVDLLGVNFYHNAIIKHDPGSVYLDMSGVAVNPPLTEMGWEVTPEYLHELLLRLKRDYGDVPIYITENGAAFPDVWDGGDVVEDPRRVDFISRHLEALSRAIADGVNVKGHCVWSLLDNYEWEKGFAKRFGIYYVDYPTQRRIPKLSALWYRDQIAASRAGS